MSSIDGHAPFLPDGLIDPFADDGSTRAAAGAPPGAATAAGIVRDGPARDPFDVAARMAERAIGGFGPDDQRLIRTMQQALAGSRFAGALDELLASGKFADMNRKFPGLIHILYHLATKPRDPRLAAQGAEPAAILGVTLARLTDPSSQGQGWFKGTCGAGTLEYMIAKYAPDEFARMADCLTLPGMTMTTRAGTTIGVPPSAIGDDGSHREALDRVLQSALMDRGFKLGYAGFPYLDGSYDDRKDDGLHNTGMYPFAFAKILEETTGQSTASASGDPGDSTALARKVEAAFQAGEGVGVALDFGKAGHWLAVDDVKYDPDGNPQSVLLRNPWGIDGGDFFGLGGPPRVMRDLEGRVAMDYADFAKALTDVDFTTTGQVLDDSPKPSVEAAAGLIARMLAAKPDVEATQLVSDVLATSSPDDLAGIVDRTSDANLRLLAQTPDGQAGLRAALGTLAAGGSGSASAASRLKAALG